jgi:hypothetical protein
LGFVVRFSFSDLVTVHFLIVDNTLDLKFSLAIFLGPFLGFAIIFLAIAAIIAMYRMQESLKKWKHSCVFYEQGYFYFFGTLYLMKKTSSFGSIYSRTVTRAVLEEEMIGGKLVTLLKIQPRQFLTPNQFILVPETLKPTVQQWLSGCC